MSSQCQGGGSVWDRSWKSDQENVSDSDRPTGVCPVDITGHCSLALTAAWFSPVSPRVQCPLSVHVSWHIQHRPHADTAATNTQWFPRVQSPVAIRVQDWFQRRFLMTRIIGVGNTFILISTKTNQWTWLKPTYLTNLPEIGVKVSFCLPIELLCSLSLPLCSSKTMHQPQRQECREGQACCCCIASQVIDSYHNTSHWKLVRVFKELKTIIDF